MRLEADLSLEQYKILGSIIDYCDSNFHQFVAFLKGVSVSKEEIESIHKEFILEGAYYHPDKSDDDLIYGE